MWPVLVFRTLHRIAFLTSNPQNQRIKHVTYHTQVSLHLISLSRPLCYRRLVFPHRRTWARGTLWAPPPAHSSDGSCDDLIRVLGRSSFGASLSEGHMHSDLLSVMGIAPHTLIMGNACSWPAGPATRGKSWWMVSTEKNTQPKSWELCFIRWTSWGLKHGR